STTLTIPAGSTEGTITVKVKGDTLDEPDETVTVTLGKPTNAGVSTAKDAGTAEGSIVDDEATAVTLSVTDGTALEGDATDTAGIRLALDRGLVSGESLAVPLAFSGGAPGTDFTLALSGSPAGVTLSDATVTFAGPASGTTDAAATVLLAASADDDTTDDTVTVSIPSSSSGGDPKLAASGLSGGATGSGSAEIVLSDSADGGVTVTGGPLSIAEADDTQTPGTRENQGTYTVVLAAAPRHDVTVTVTAPAGLLVDGPDDGTDGTDSETLTFTTGNWNTAQTVTVSGVDDDIDQGAAYTLSVTHAAASSDQRYDKIGIDPVAVTVTDDEARPVAALALSTASVAENGGAATVTATLDRASSEAVTLTVAAAPVDPATASDFTLSSATTLTIAAGETASTGTVTVTAVDNAVDNPDRSVTVSARASGGHGVAAPADRTLTIVDDEKTAVTLARSGSGFIAENGGTEDITVTLGRPLAAGESVSVPLAVTGATVATHYTLAKKGSAAGVTVSTSDLHSDQNPAVSLSGAGVSGATLTLTAKANTDTVERTASIAFGTGNRKPTQSGLSGGLSLAGSPVAVPIADDDSEITIAPASAAEGSAVTFTVSLPRPAPDGGVTVRYRTADGRGDDNDDTWQVATSADYTAAAANASLAIAAGERTGTVSIATTQDSSYEGDHYFTVTLDSATRMTIGTGSAVGTITDNDDRPTFAFSSATASVGEGAGNLTVTVNKTGATELPSSVAYETADGTATAGKDYTAASGTLAFAASDTAKTFTVAIVDDVLHEGNEQFTVKLLDSGTSPVDAVLGAIKAQTATITDDDAAPSAITLSVDADTDTPGTQSEVAENGGASTARVTATIDGATRFAEDKDVTLTVGKNGDSAVEGTDYVTVADLTLTIPAGARSGDGDFTLTPTNDALAEATETISIEGALASVTFTHTSIDISDDEATPVATLALSPASVAENGGAATVTATLDRASSEAVTLTVAAAP
ncbi:MAG: hypothetical protein F4118_01645, partial [Acidimicrobiaceae bacterium]|nr:hypothetical protein [Acidimicrobiaceae bacterium]